MIGLDQGGHEEERSDGIASAAGASIAVGFSALVGMRSKAGERGDFASAGVSEFRHETEQARSDDGAETPMLRRAEVAFFSGA